MWLEAPPDHVDVFLVPGVHVLPQQNPDVREDHLVLVQSLIAFVLHEFDMLV